MKKIYLLAGAALFSLMGTVSCQSKVEEESLDNYEITLIGTKENQMIKYESAPLYIGGFNTDNLVANADVFVGDPILFKGNDHFSIKETKLFAEKNSYYVSLDDEIHTYGETKFKTYSSVVSSRITFSLKDPEKYTGRCVFALIGDLIEYTVKPKDTSRETFNVYVGSGPMAVDFIQL